MRLGVVAASVAAMLVAGGGTASANVVWCRSDPPIPVVTPGGNHLTINNTIYVLPADRQNASLITDDASTAPDGMGGTLITVHVYIPAAVHAANVVSSNNRYHVNDTKSTPGGGAVLTLSLDVPTS